MFPSHDRIARNAGAKKGTPDIIAIRRGKTYYIELKAGSTQSAAQKAIQREIEQHGGEYFLITSIKEFQIFVKAFEQPITEVKKNGVLVMQASLIECLTFMYNTAKKGRTGAVVMPAKSLEMEDGSLYEINILK